MLRADLMLKTCYNATFPKIWHICIFWCMLPLNTMGSNLIASKKEPEGPDVLRSHIWGASGGRIETTMISLYLSLRWLRNWLSEWPSRLWSNIVNSAVFQNKSWSCVTLFHLHHYKFVCKNTSWPTGTWIICPINNKVLMLLVAISYCFFVVFFTTCTMNTE